MVPSPFQYSFLVLFACFILVCLLTVSLVLFSILFDYSSYLLSDNVSYPNAPRGMSWIDEMYVLYVCILTLLIVYDTSNNSHKLNVIVLKL